MFCSLGRLEGRPFFLRKFGANRPITPIESPAGCAAILARSEGNGRKATYALTKALFSLYFFPAGAELNT
jgi:hypothetical protein